MEFIIGLIVVAFAAYFLFFRTKKVSTPEVVAVPYKVESTTVAVPVVEEVKVEAPAPVVEATPEPVAIVAPVKAPRKPRAAKPAAAKVVKEKAPAKARAPKVVAKVAAKAPAKKPVAIKAKSKKA